jgi:hypothetical protein
MSKAFDLRAKASQSLDRVLDTIRSSSQSKAWQFSLLTKSGFPLEFTFSSQEEGLRYTVEVASPEVPASERLSRTLKLLAVLDLLPLSGVLLDRISQVQASGSLTWGAWLGVRHRINGDRYKLYAQLPESAIVDSLVQDYLGEEPLLDRLIPVAIGHEFGSSRTEFYFRFDRPGLEYWEIAHLLHRFNLGHRGTDLFNLIQEIRGDAPPALPAITYGCSIAVSDRDEPAILSIFTFAGTLLQSDAKIRKQILSIAERRGWNFQNYAALTESIADLKDESLYHNVIAFVIAPQGEPILHISLSPPSAIAEQLKQPHSFPQFFCLNSPQVRFCPIDLNKPIARALNFLLENRHKEGYWSDFNLAPGASDEWVTGYVGTTIAEIETCQARVAALKAWNWLKTRCQMTPGWGYNDLVPRDADSTTWGLQLAQSLGCHQWQEVLCAEDFLLQHLDSNGGIKTYTVNSPIRHFIGASEGQSLQGWCMPHVCVTAAAAMLPKFRDRCLDFLRQNQCSDGRWKSYWWCEDEYATALAAEAFARQGIYAPIQNAVQWAYDRVALDGSVPSKIQPSGSPFATAWVLRLLLLNRDRQAIQSTLDKVLDWLLNHQQSDGSWVSSAGLRVPPPNMIQPDHYQDWHLHGLVEGGISLDQNRIFTTATVLQALRRVST